MSNLNGSNIHKTSIIEDGAKIGKNCYIGPFCTIGKNVKLEENVKLVSHISINGNTVIGNNTKIWPFASIGNDPQDLKYGGESTFLEIGSRNKIRECVSINPGTSGGGGITKIGNDCLFMLGSHVGHDCKVGNNVVMTNNSALAGHVIVEDKVIIGGLSGIHQHCRIGEGAMIGALSMVANDVIPFTTVMGERANLVGLNIIGLRRRGGDNEEIKNLKEVYKELFQPNVVLREKAIEISEQKIESELVNILLSFISSTSKRSFTKPNS